MKPLPLISSLLFLLGLASTAHSAVSITEKNLAYYWDFNTESSLTSFSSETLNTANITNGGATKTWVADGSKADDSFINLSTANGRSNAFKMTSLSGGDKAISLGNFSISFDIKDYASGSVLFNLNNSKTINNSLGIWGGGGTSTIGTPGVINAENTTDWATYVFAFSGNTMSVYRNGILANTLEGHNLSGNLTFLTFGGDSNNETTPAIISAKFDNLAIWNTSMTADDAALLYNSKTPSQLVPEPGAATLALLGLSGFLIRRRRSKNS